MSESPQPLAYTTATAAQAVGMSDEYLRKEIRAGRLGCRYAGRSLLIPAEELKAWLDALPSERPQDPREFRVVDLCRRT
ncbi:excisionase family DNA-binding protein [Rhodococcus sp. T2V]|nr:excisionase family DNA-binding protein [Rhodococcus sp. T2V]MDF3310947.1 excisionase family DNA-binding protein [Rhodococcus sp. T2V]